MMIALVAALGWPITPFRLIRPTCINGISASGPALPGFGVVGKRIMPGFWCLRMFGCVVKRETQGRLRFQRSGQGVLPPQR